MHESHSTKYPKLILCPTNRGFSLSTPCYTL